MLMCRLGRLWELLIFRLFAVYFRMVGFLDVIFSHMILISFMALTGCVKPAFAHIIVL